MRILDFLSKQAPRAGVRVGAVFPLTGPALGRALPAAQAAFRRHLSEIRRTGYAVSVEEYEPGVNAVASRIERARELREGLGIVGGEST